MAIAEAVVSGALEEWRRLQPPVRLVRIGVAIGELHQVVEDNFRMAYDVMARGTALEGVPVEIRRIPVKVTCKQCGETTRIEMPFFVCGVCGGGDLEVVEGNEMHLDRLEVEADHDVPAKH